MSRTPGPVTRALRTLATFCALAAGAAALTALARPWAVLDCIWALQALVVPDGRADPQLASGIAGSLVSLALTWLVSLAITTAAWLAVRAVRGRTERARAAAEAPADVLRAERAVAARCPHCHDELARLELDGALRCPGCGTAHHAECWRTHAGCSVHACGRGPSDARASATRDLGG